MPNRPLAEKWTHQKKSNPRINNLFFSQQKKTCINRGQTTLSSSSGTDWNLLLIPKNYDHPDGNIWMLPKIGVSQNRGTPKSSILIRFPFYTNHLGVPLFLETPICFGGKDGGMGQPNEHLSLSPSIMMKGRRCHLEKTIAVTAWYSHHTQDSKVVSPHLWYTPLNLYHPAIKGFLS